MHVALTPRAGAPARGAARVLRRPGHPRGARRALVARPASSATRRSTRTSSASSAPTAGSGIGWPKEYGGQDRSMIEQLIFTDVAAVAGVPIPYLTLNTVGPTIMRYGTDEQKDVLPAQDPRRASCTSRSATPSPAPAPTSPRCKTRAVREGDEWVINGQKMWTSLIQYADWIWLACRTDPDLPRHKGLSMILVPADAAGLLLHAGAHGRRRRHQRDVLRGRAGPGRQPGRRAQRRLVADDQPAQPRAGRAHLGGAADALDRAGPRRGRRRPRTPTASG